MKAGASPGLFATWAGPTDGIPAVLLHGFGADAGVWAGVQRALEGEIGSLAYDLPGHGRSVDCPGFEKPGRIAAAIAADLQARGLGRFHLAGHSMGGAVASLIALREAEPVASMTLLAPGGYGPQINHRLLRRYASAGTPSAMRAVLGAMAGENSPIPDEAVKAFVEARRTPGHVAKLAVILDNMLVAGEPEPVQGVFPRADLETLPMPVRVLWGTRDEVLPAAQAERLPPGFAVHLLKGAGHMLIEEREAETVDHIRRTVRGANRQGVRVQPEGFSG